MWIFLNNNRGKHKFQIVILNFLLLSSVTRLGDFGKFLATNLPSKVAPKECWLFGFLKRSIIVKTAVGIIQATFENIWATF